MESDDNILSVHTELRKLETARRDCIVRAGTAHEQLLLEQHFGEGVCLCGIFCFVCSD